MAVSTKKLYRVFKYEIILYYIINMKYNASYYDDLLFKINTNIWVSRLFSKYETFPVGGGPE